MPYNRRPKQPSTYILASKPNGILYTGVTSDLSTRMSDHVNGLYEGFTKRYAVKSLVYYEMHVTMDDAIKREKRIKDWKRAWKTRLIQNFNPEWRDLYNRDTGELESGPADVERTRGRT